VSRRSDSSRTEPNRAKPSRAEPKRAYPSRAEHIRAESIQVRLNVNAANLDPYVEFLKEMSKASLAKRVVGTASRIKNGNP